MGNLPPESARYGCLCCSNDRNNSNGHTWQVAVPSTCLNEQLKFAQSSTAIVMYTSPSSATHFGLLHTSGATKRFVRWSGVVYYRALFWNTLLRHWSWHWSWTGSVDINCCINVLILNICVVIHARELPQFVQQLIPLPVQMQVLCDMTEKGKKIMQSCIAHVLYGEQKYYY